MGHRILVVDDETDITALVAYHLAREGYRVTTAANGAEGLRAAVEGRPDLVLLDVMMPEKSGYDVLRDLRGREDTRHMGVIMLTARKAEEDRIEGLAEGADDYIVKPFSPRELVLRVQAVLRRIEAPAVITGARIVVGPITVDPAAHRVEVDGEELTLTATEYRLLSLLAERRGRVQSRASLLQSVWDAHPDIQTRTVDMHVQRLRSKLGRHGELVETVRGFGYRLQDESKHTR